MNARLSERFPILMVGNFLSGGGSHTVSVAEELAGRLAAAGWDVMTTSNRRNRVVRLADMVTTILARRNQFRVATVDVFSGPAFRWAEAACSALRLVKKPYVLVLHGGRLPEFSRRWPGRVRRLLASARAVVTPSPYLHHEMAHCRGDLILLPNAINLGACRFRVRSHPRPRLIWMRALAEIYNPRLAVRVVAMLADEFPDLRLTMLGPEREAGVAATVERLAEELQVSDRVRLAGPAAKEDVPSWLDAEDVFINTTNADNTPVSVLEGLACGLCVVSTNVGGIPYILSHEGNALLVPPDDASAMAAAVRRFLTDPQLAERVSRNARTTCEALDWDVVLPRWGQLLSSVAGDQSPRIRKETEPG